MPGNNLGSKQVADSKANKITDFLASMQSRVARTESRAALKKASGNKSSGNRLNRKQRKAAEKSAKQLARRDAGIANGTVDPNGEEEVFSGSASLSFERKRRRTDHFSFSESEHYRDCSTTSSSSSSSSSSSGHHGKKKCGDKKKKKKEHHKKQGYRLRHCRVHAEESRTRKNELSLSASASIDLGEIDASGSLSASAEFERRQSTVLRVCEDELSRRRKGGCKDQRYYAPDFDPYVRVDYRKKIYYNDEAERKFDASLSASLSIDIEEDPTTTVTVAATTTSSPPAEAPSRRPSKPTGAVKP